MKDNDRNLRGGCNSCQCQEYVFNPRSVQCTDCGCLVTRHIILESLDISNEDDVGRSRGRSVSPSRYRDVSAEKRRAKSPSRAKSPTGRTSIRPKSPVGTRPAKESEINSVDNNSKPFSTPICRRSFFLWFLISFTLIGFTFSNKKGKKNQIVKGLHSMATICYFFMTLITYISYVYCKTPKKKYMILATFYLNLIAFGTFGLMNLRLSPTMKDGNGKIFELGFAVEGFMTIPIIISLMKESFGTVKKQHQLGYSTFLFNICFFASNFTRRPYSSWLMVFGSFFLSLTVLQIFGQFLNSNNVKPGGKNARLDPNSINKLAFVGIVYAVLNPVLWYMTTFKQMNQTMNHTMICSLDLFLKISFTILILNSNTERNLPEGNLNLNSLSEGFAKELIESMESERIMEKIRHAKNEDVDHLQSATVIISDIFNYSQLSDRLPTKEFINAMGKMWEQYDIISKKWGIEKAGVLNDAFVGSSGCITPTHNHAANAVGFAFNITEMARSIEELKQFQIRMRIHSGPITVVFLNDGGAPRHVLLGDTLKQTCLMDIKNSGIFVSEMAVQIAGGLEKFSQNKVKSANLNAANIDIYEVYRFA